MRGTVLLFIYWAGVESRPLVGPLDQPQMMMIMSVEQLVKLMSGRGDRNIRRTPDPVSLCPPSLARWEASDWPPELRLGHVGGVVEGNA